MPIWILMRNDFDSRCDTTSTESGTNGGFLSSTYYFSQLIAFDQWMFIMKATNQEYEALSLHKSLFCHNYPPSGPILALDTSPLPKLHGPTCCMPSSKVMVILGSGITFLTEFSVRLSISLLTSLANLPDIAPGKASKVKKGHLNKKHI